MDDKMHQCNLCLKFYSNRQNLWRHKNNEHSNYKENNKKCGFDCEYCGKNITRHNNLIKHQEICKKGVEYKMKEKMKEELENSLEKKLEEKMEEKIKREKERIREELKEEIKNDLFKKAKIHPKTLKKINNQLINNTNNGLINNGNINNITFSFGKENISSAISNEKKIEILNRRLNSINYLIEYMHFNDDMPQYKNILITNMQNNIGYIYEQTKQQFISINKDDLLEKIIDMRMIDIEDFYNVCKDKLSEITKKKLNVLLEDINKSKFRDEKKNEIKLIIYNNKHKVKQ